MIDQKILRRIADADTSSKFWGSALQEKAQEILDILIRVAGAMMIFKPMI